MEKITARGGPVNGRAPARPRLRPRKPSPFEDEDYRPPTRRKAAPPPDPWEAEDALDSRTIARSNKRHTVPPAQCSWHDSDAAAFLANLPRSRLWVPCWVAGAAGGPARAVLLSWVLGIFSEGLEKDDAGTPLPRPRLRDEAGRLVWQATRRQVADETLLDIHKVDRAITALADHDLIEVSSSHKGLLIRPRGAGLARAYYDATRDADVADELKQYGDALDWYGSLARRRAEANATGTFVHDAVTVICDYDPAMALVLAHALYWHGLDDDGRSRARVTRHGRLWVARSYRQMSGNPGGDGRALARQLAWLAERGFLQVEPSRWVYDRRKDLRRPTLHFRPCPERIGAALEDRAAEIGRVIARKRAWADAGGLEVK